MTKKFPLFLLLVVFMTSFVYAQTRNVQIHKKQIIDENIKTTSSASTTVDHNPDTHKYPLDAGDEMIRTGYDIESNVATRRMIDMVDIDFDGTPDPMVVAMKRDVEGGDRFIMFSYKAFGVVDLFNAFDPSQTPFGWPEVQSCVGGTHDGDALVMGHVGGVANHSWIDLTNLEPRQPFPATTFGGNWPSFVYLTDGTILGMTTDLIFYISTDDGVTFDSLLSIGDGDPNVDFSSPAGPAENPLRKSNDDMVIATLGGFSGVDVDSTDNPDIIYWYGSTDGGATWNGIIAGVGSGDNPEYGQVTNRDYAPYFTNFSQVNLTIDPTGVSHVLCNGYGEGPYMGGPDTVDVYPMLYWNSANQEWIAITDEAMEAPDDGFGNTISDNYSYNAIGNAYGTIATSSDGQIVIAMWMGPEWTGTIGSSAYNIYPGDGGTFTTPLYYTNIYYSASEDGGASWGPVGIVQGDVDVHEQNPVLAKDLQIDGNQATAHYIYYFDPIPGAGGTGQNNENGFDPDGIWYYNTYTWTLTTGVEDEIVVNNFKLEQNYPNPFNPSTNIKYTLSEQSPVSLKVYDVLGNEVATLVNTTQDVGAYDINFDAANLASGLYIYTLQAGNFTSTKKMMLLK